MKKFLALTVLMLIFAGSVQAIAGDVEKSLSHDLTECSRILQRIADSSRTGSPVADDITLLKKSAETIQADRLLLVARHGNLAGRTATSGGTISDRQEAVSSTLIHSLDDLLSRLEAIDTSISATDLETLKQLLETLVPHKSRPLLGALPYKHTNYPSREPAASPLVKPAYKGGDRAVFTADTATTTEAPISREIVDLAQSLQWNPVLIYEWVKNNIETEWYWGSMKGAEETLRQRSGNDADQAALLVALLRAANFPARYVKGTIEFFPDISKARNLIGLDDPVKIHSFLQKAGIPVKPVIAGGVISNFHFEHIWVEAFVPYANYRGAVIDDQGKVWLGLDTSIKPRGYTRIQGAGVPPDILSVLRGDYLNSVQNLTPLDYLKGRLDDSLAATLPGKTWNDLKDSAVLIPDVLKIIPSSLQFPQIAITGEYQTLPDELRHKVAFTATTDGSELFTLTLDTQRLSGRKVTLRSEPETVEDQNTIDSFGGLDNTPPYLVRLRPVLTIDGERMVVAGDGLPMGGDYTLSMDVITPNGTERITSSQINGNLSVIGVVAQKAATPAAISNTDDAETILHKEAIGYIDRWNGSEDDLATLLGQTVTRPTVTIATVGAQLEVTNFLDTPHDMQWKGLFLDAGYKRVESVGRNGNETDFMRLSALQGSILENRIFEDDLKVDSVSTAKLLQQARAGATSVITIDKANVDAVLPMFPFDDAVISDITNAVNQGLTVTIPQNEVAYQNWTGIGYVKENPETGESGWMLSGGVAGGMTAVNKNEWILQDLANTLSVPNSTGTNSNPNAVRRIVRISASDYQEGTAGKALLQPVMVMALDDSGRPVANVTVVFRCIAGGGFLGVDAASATAAGLSEYQVTTGSNGVARAFVILGKQTSVSPYFVQKSQTYAYQVGQNLVDVRASAPGGVIAVDKPFEAYGYPGDAVKMVKVAESVTDDIYGLSGMFAGSVWVQVADEYDNPVSNKQVTFSIKPQSYGASPHPIETEEVPIRNAKLLPTVNTCPGSPSLECGQCAERLQVISSIAGSNAQVILGNTEGTDFFIEARAFRDVNGHETDVLIDPVTFTYHSRRITERNESRATTYLTSNINYHFDSRGNRIDAGKAGSLFSQPLSATLYRSEEATVPATKDSCISNCYYLKGTGVFKTSRIDNGTVTFNTPGIGTVSPAVVPDTSGGQPEASVANGIYETRLTLGPEPGRNIISVDSSALLPVKQINTSSGEVFVTQQTLTAKSSIEIWGVQPQLESDIWILTNSKGYPTGDIPLRLLVSPLEYPVGSMSVRFFENDQYMGEVPVQNTEGVLSTGGAVFKSNAAYYARLSLLDGAIMSDPARIRVVSVDLAIDSDNISGLNADGTHKDPIISVNSESIEDTPGLPGKLIPINDRNRNGDGLPDFADGYDLFTPQPADNASAAFVPILLKIPETIDLTQARIRFTYNASDPAGVTISGVTYVPAPGGHIRIWNKDGGKGRLKASVSSGGSYIKPGDTLSVSQLAGTDEPRTWRLFVEGIVPSSQFGEELIRVDIDPDGDGPAPFMVADEVRATVNKALLITDFNHDRIIDDSDRLRAALGSTFYFWVNDDMDLGDIDTSDETDIPQKKSFFRTRNGEDNHINGTRDLEDFFPVQLDIQEQLQKFPPTSYKYVLKQEDSALNFAFTELGANDSGKYLTDASEGGVAKGLANKATFQIENNGYVLNKDSVGQQFLQNILLNNTGVILVEGRDVTSKPLVLEIIDKSGKLVLISSLNISIAGVEQMFRHKNLMQEMHNIEYELLSPVLGITKIQGHPVPDNKGEKDRLQPKDFENYKHFAGFTDDNDNNENVIYMHGYNVNGDAARGEMAGIFKRLFWSGSRVNFLGITWYGWDSQDNLLAVLLRPLLSHRTSNYHVNVRHAYNTGILLNDFVTKKVSGKNILIAHSLGNMVASTAIQNGISYERYIMTNPAVAEEAYTPDDAYEEGANWTLNTRPLMYHPKWRYPHEDINKDGFKPFLWASEWYRRFDNTPDDLRAKLTWRNLFEKVRKNQDVNKNTFAFFSPTDEAFVPFNFNPFMTGTSTANTQVNVDDVPGLEDILQSAVTGKGMGIYAFAYQELFKGRIWPLVVKDSYYGGWGFNRVLDDGYYTCSSSVEPKDGELPPPGCTFITTENAATLNPENLKTRPLFKKNPEKAHLFEAGPVLFTAAEQFEMLANEIPALTFAAGHGGVDEFDSVENINVINKFLPQTDTPWPRAKKEWKHSDLHNVAYSYTYRMFDAWNKIIIGGELP